MKASLIGFATIGFASLCLTGCPSETESSTTPEPPKDPAPATVSAEPAASTATNDPKKPTINAKVVAEIDGKDADAATGAAMSIATKGAFAAPKGWQPAKDAASGFTIANSSDKKASVAAIGVKDGEDPTSKLDKGVAALKLSSCEWEVPASVSVGKDKLAGTAADGICKRGDTLVRMARVAVQADGVNALAIGAWDDGSDGKGIFQSFRSGKKVVPGKAAPDPVAACCNAISQNQASAPPEHQGAYAIAAAACNAARGSAEGRAALGGVRAALAGVGMPPACQ